MGDLLIRLLGVSRGRSLPSFPLSSICCWMDSAQGSSQKLPIKKQEDDDRAPKQEVKPVVKTLNRVPRMAIIFDIHPASHFVFYVAQVPVYVFIYGFVVSA